MSTQYADSASDPLAANPAAIHIVTTASGHFYAVRYTGENPQAVQQLAASCQAALDALWVQDAQPQLFKLWDNLSGSWRWVRPGDWIIGVGDHGGVFVLDHPWFQLLFLSHAATPADRLTALADLATRMQGIVADLASSTSAVVSRHGGEDRLSAANLRHVPHPGPAFPEGGPLPGDVWTDATGMAWAVGVPIADGQWWSATCTDENGRTATWGEVNTALGPMSFHHRPERTGMWSSAA